MKERHIDADNELLWNFPTEDKNKALNRVNDVTNTVDKPGFFGCLSIFFHFLALMLCPDENWMCVCQILGLILVGLETSGSLWWCWPQNISACVSLLSLQKKPKKCQVKLVCHSARVSCLDCYALCTVLSVRYIVGDSSGLAWWAYPYEPLGFVEPTLKLCPTPVPPCLCVCVGVPELLMA